MRGVLLLLQELMSEVTSAAKRKKMQTRLSYTGWLDWQKKVRRGAEGRGRMD